MCIAGIMVIIVLILCFNVSTCLKMKDLIYMVMTLIVNASARMICQFLLTLWLVSSSSGEKQMVIVNSLIMYLPSMIAYVGSYPVTAHLASGARVNKIRLSCVEEVELLCD